MKTTKEQRKEKALELMKQLKIYKPYINDFKKDNIVTYFEHHIGFGLFKTKNWTTRLNSLKKSTTSLSTLLLTKF